MYKVFEGAHVHKKQDFTKFQGDTFVDGVQLFTSIQGDGMLDTITYSEDCTVRGCITVSGRQ